MIARLVVLAGVPIAGIAACLAAEPAAVDPGALQGPEAEVAAAIQSLRGHSKAHLSPGEYGALGEKLDAAWDVLRKHPDPARKAMRDVLANEREDSFLIIDLADLYTSMEHDPASLKLAAGALTRADVRVHPSGTFHALSRMASLDCGPCLPAVLRILELKDPSTFIAQHALTIDAELGVLFTLGQYGDAAIRGTEAALRSPDCVGRANAARALAFFLPERIPPALRDMPLADSCPEARLTAWRSLGLLDDPALPAMVRRRRAATPPPERDERLAMAEGLALTFAPGARQVLEQMRADPDAEVAKQAADGASDLEEVERRMGALAAWGRSESPPPGHAQTVRALEKGERDGRYEVESFMEDLVPHLTPDDIPLLNRVRAAVLGRLSDECLYEYYPLTHTVRVLRLLRARAEPVGPGATSR
jgi:hypothetical protein